MSDNSLNWIRMDTKEEFDDEQLFKEIEQHNRNVNVAVSLTIVATMLIGVVAMRTYLMSANAQEIKSEIELKFEDDVKRFKEEIANASDSSQNIKPHYAKMESKAALCQTVMPSDSMPIFKNPKTKDFYKRESSPKASRIADRHADLHVDINTADTAGLRKLPGIGEKRAINIVKYRTSLGGFYCVEQLAEVYSMDAEIVERIRKYIICDGHSVNKIDINNTNPYKLWHPYLKGELLKNLKQRLKSGKRYKSFEDIKAENGYDEALNGKAEMYLEF